MRKIIHVDMDAFYAQVEMRDNPTYVGKPIIIGSGDPHHGVVSTCSYEARKFGVRSAMPNSKAYKLCPHAIFVRQSRYKYKNISKQIFKIFHEVSDTIEGISLDEAYIDVTTNKLNLESATKVAVYIKERIYEETKLTASAGVSYNKLLAKLASEYNKPNGLTVVTPKNAQQFLKQNKLRDLPGIGKSTQKKLDTLGIFTIEDFLNLDLEQCNKFFGVRGEQFYNFVRGIDKREVIPNQEQKSISNETTLQVPYDNIFQTESLLDKLTRSTLLKLQKKKTYCKTFSVKIKYSDFTQYTRSVTLKFASNTEVDFTKHIHNLLMSFPHQNKQIRLIGVSFSNLVDKDHLDNTNYKQYKQTKLF